MAFVFLELLQVSLGGRDKLSRVPSEAEWEVLFLEAQRQCVVGVLLDGVEHLPAEQLPYKQMLLQWIGLGQITDNAYSLQCNRAKELTERMGALGIRSCVLKGVGVAQLYPSPSHRQCGDIDLWVDRSRDGLMPFLSGKYEIGMNVWHHAEVKFFDDVETEIHFHPGWMYNPFDNRRLQQWFEMNKSAQMEVDDKLGFAYPSVQFNAVYSLVHLFHHLIEEGVGLRHIIDYYFIMRALPTDARLGVVQNLKRLGLYRLAKAVMWVLQEVCGMSSDLLLCKSDEREGRFLMDEVMRGGNFGHHRKDNRRRNSVARMLALLPHYPREVLWVVPWKLWHKCWRFFHS